MTVFNTVDQAKQFWSVLRLSHSGFGSLADIDGRCRIKGKQFTIPSLLTGGDESDSSFEAIQRDPKCALSIARLAPQDYHRFHSPVTGTVGPIKDIQGELHLREEVIADWIG